MRSTGVLVPPLTNNCRFVSIGPRETIRNGKYLLIVELGIVIIYERAPCEVTTMLVRGAYTLSNRVVYSERLQVPS